MDCRSPKMMNKYAGPSGFVEPRALVRVNADTILKARRFLLELTEDERVATFAGFCTDCGSDDSECQCWNDE